MLNRAGNNLSVDSTSDGGAFNEIAAASSSRGIAGNTPRQPPTLLQLGQLSTGASKLERSSMLRTMFSESDDDYLDRDDCVEEKLREARCLLRANWGFQNPVALFSHLPRLVVPNFVRGHWWGFVSAKPTIR